MNKPSRRTFVKAGAVSLASAMGVHSFAAPQEKSRNINERLRVGCIGMRYQGSVIAHKAQTHGDIVAICDVDRHVREQSRASFGSTPSICEDYRDLLSKANVDVVTIGTPDHWHAKILVDSVRAGLDVYCEKPLTLTIDEGKHIRKAVETNKRIVQVGSWQRSDHRFRLAVEMVRQGRIGKLQRVEVVLGKNQQGGPFKIDQPPPQLNWDLWQGPTPEVPFMHERSHYTFRWWYAYSGGQMTDWGAHHLDIAQWAINEYPTRIKTTANFPTVENGYDVARDFFAEYNYPSGVVMTVKDHGRNGIMFVGDAGRIFVNRGVISGRPVESLKSNPLPRRDFQVYGHDNLDRPQRLGKLDAINNHMGNFFDSIRTREQPISDIESQHRSVSTCHLGNISMWEQRELQWDSKAEKFVDDVIADKRLSRERRDGYGLDS